MDADRQPDTRDGRKRHGHGAGRRALTVGLALSALLHLILIVLNPTFRFELPPRSAGAGETPQEPGRLIQIASGESSPLTARTSPAAEPSATPVTPRPSAPVRARDAQPAAGGEGAAPGPDPRLRYRPGSIWAPMQRPAETIEECRERMLAARLERGIADETYGVAPPPDRIVPPPARRGIGFSIPFGTRRPPPAEVVPAPLPDSLRAASRRPPPSRSPADRTLAPFDAECLSDTTLRMLPPSRSNPLRQ